MHVVHESRCPEIGPICDVRDEPPNLHDLVLWVAEVRAIVEYGFTESWALEVQVPFKMTGSSIVYRRLDGTAFVPDYGEIHHRNETVAGAGDVWVSARYTTALAGVDLSARLGVSLPFGSTEPDPFALGERGLAHQHIQLGTGTFDPIGAIEGAYAIGPVELRAILQAQLVLYENVHGYRAGNRYGASLIASAEPLDWLRLSLGLDLVNEQTERWSGEVKQDGNLGRTDLLAGGSATLLLGDTELSAGVKVPIYQDIIMSADEPGQLTFPALISFTAAQRF